MATFREAIHRLLGALGGGRRDADLQEELRLHLELAAEEARRRGGTPEQAAREGRLRAGGATQALEAVRDQRGLPWLDALASDLVFGLRQLTKHRSASAVAVLSLGLAIGATTAAFRLVDAVLLRPLPVAEPDRLFFLAHTRVGTDGRSDDYDDFDYPTFQKYVGLVGDRGEVMLVGAASPAEVVLGGGHEVERPFRQFVSGNVFPVFGLRPELGRLLTPEDNRTVGGHPVAVISHDYWVRRFGRDPAVIGRTFRLANQQYEIVGVAPRGFTGTEPGSITDLFLPAMMHTQALNSPGHSPGWSWLRIWVRPTEGSGPEPIREMLQAVFRAEHLERVKTLPPDTPKERIVGYLNEQVLIFPAGSGASGVQKNFRRPLVILAALGALVLVIACANVANLLTAQAMTRAREMALRMSIGAGRARLIHLVLMESALLAIFATAVGTLFAAWSAPLVVSLLSPPERTIRLVLETDWRAIVFGVGLAAVVTFLFGLAPALRASSIRPVATLKGGEHQRTYGRLATSLVAVQMAFCVFVLFVAGLFVYTLNRMTNHPLGFSHERVLILMVEGGKAQAPASWEQVVDHLRQRRDVESAAFAGWPPLSGNGWTATVRVPGRAIETRPPYFLEVSPRYFETMRIERLEGRDFRPGDGQPMLENKVPRPGVGIVNEAFARAYFDGQSPVGRRVAVNDADIPMEIVGLVRDTVYRTLREGMRPTVFVPAKDRGTASLVIRTAGDPEALAQALGRDVARARPDFRVRNFVAQSALVRAQMIRERLLATLTAFFATVALLLAGLGLYGVLHYAVIQQRREIGVRMALGARAAQVVRSLTTRVLAIAGIGALVGLGGGLAFARLLQGLLFEVKPTDPATMAAPMLILVAAATLAALPPAIRAVRIDPAQTLRSE